MFTVRTEKNHEHIIGYPKVDEKLDIRYNGKIVEKW